MKSAYFLLLMLVYTQLSFAQGIPPIGQWRDHLPMRSVHTLLNSSSSLLGGTSFGYFTYDPATKEINTTTKAVGLSEVELKLLSKKPTGDLLLAIYQNANMDLISGDNIRNLPDLLRFTTREDKSVNQVSWLGDDAYLSTNLGIVVVNADKKEIKNTYRLSADGSAVSVFQTAFLNGVVYAATEKGLYKASLSATSLTDFRNWSIVPVLNATSSVQRVINWNNQLIVQRNDSLFVHKNDNWNLLYTIAQPITALDGTNDQLFIGHSFEGKGTVVVLDAGSLIPKLFNNDLLTYPTAVVQSASTLWAADLKNGIINLSDPNTPAVFPSTPAGFAWGEAVVVDDQVWVTTGKLNGQATPSFPVEGVFSFKNEQWSSIDATVFPALASLKELSAVAYSSATGSLFVGAIKGGLFELTKENKPILYQQNSFLAPVFSNPNQYSVGGLAIDKDQHLWMTNNGARQGLVVKKTDGAIQKFTIPFTYTDFGLSKLMVDDQNRKWLITSNGDGLICYDQGSSLENIADDRWRHFKQGLGRGNLPSNKVTSVAVDRNGFIWVGTDKGVAVIQCGEDLFNVTACEAVLPVVQQDNFAGRLLAEEQINDIKVDGADRKWMATNNGVWLLSADGQQVISRFTSSNSNLLNNQVYSMIIVPSSGEVFFMTQKGICSYRGTSTEPAISTKKLYVFPNPVPPGYAGTIAIRDLPENAWVSITELDGRLVYKTRSLGGQAIWNGKNYKGEKVSSGVYLILVANEFNTQQLAGKLFFLK